MVARASFFFFIPSFLGIVSASGGSGSVARRRLLAPRAGGGSEGCYTSRLKVTNLSQLLRAGATAVVPCDVSALPGRAANGPNAPASVPRAADQSSSGCRASTRRLPRVATLHA